MSEVVVLPWCVASGGGGDGVAVDEDLDGADVAGEASGVGVRPRQPWIEWRLRSGHLEDRGGGGALFALARLVVDRREVVDRRMQSVRVEPPDPFGGLPLDLGSAGP